VFNERKGKPFILSEYKFFVFYSTKLLTHSILLSGVSESKFQIFFHFQLTVIAAVK